MIIGYVDTSCLVSIAFDEPHSPKIRARVDAYDTLVSSNLMEAELRSALHREGVAASPAALLSRIAWVHPDRALTTEYDQVLGAGYVRGADLWHLACALYLRQQLGELHFLTLDQRQASAADALGFASGP